MSRLSRWTLFVVLPLVVGCGTPESPIVEKYRIQFLQSTLDGQPISIKNAMVLEDGATETESSSAADATQSEGQRGTDDQFPDNAPRAEQFVVAGKIYGGDVPAFDADNASFTIIELPEPGHDHEDPGDCVFCKRKLDEAEMAVVHLVDDSNNVIEIPANRLLDLKPGQNILAKGKIGVVGDMLVVRATQLRVMDDVQAREVYSILNASR